MGKRTTRRPGRQEARQRPSAFFFVALAAGVLLLLWVMSKVITTPISPQKPSPASSRTRS